MAEHIFMTKSALDGGLKIEFTPLPASAELPPNLAWGKCLLLINNIPVWSEEVDGQAERAVEWSWIDLLEGLGRIWPWLILEESYPIPISPEHPGLIEREILRRWSGMSDTEVEAEEDLMFDFLHRHNLSLLLRGISLPPLFFIREGNEFLIWSQALPGPVRLDFKDALQVLTQFGDYLYSIVKDSNDSRALLAMKYWSEKDLKLAKSGLAIRTGMSPEELIQIFPIDVIQEAANDSVNDCEIYAAARMTSGRLEFSAQAEIIRKISSLEKVTTPILDHLSETVPNAETFGLKGYEQGYGLAAWLRQKLSLGDGKVNPEELLASWGVVIQQMEMTDFVSAVAVWGERHGPAVVLNSKRNARSATKHGRLTTLAHEICHLLYDRSRSLPVADVLGGLGPKFAEQRANAFAAEFLLPRSSIAAWGESESVLEFAKQLQRKYTVSPELVSYQIYNSDLGGAISRQDRLKLERWVGEARSFQI
ncbi:ImmA/IrrE family metallo-endopeptidase [Pseudomonas aeruginosa]|uniref:ImmA/IrrE family metallo-endopeptidase n=1 Tax=Pseudomonas aeruginosa TaxID=287 RepID=UPI0024AEF719|nr:ImmA/IrrE family metallo-endopeptidase [Pseudomonas aeruginosa]MDI7134228.1 ImmA/IrrE family metallo-endopeptidase [Pseudomonas aeruginosa]